jgi:predicted regulator of Ras-like GTPase activity (Roadblock/LC7/MglB family)
MMIIKCILEQKRVHSLKSDAITVADGLPVVEESDNIDDTNCAAANVNADETKDKI